MKYEHFSEGDRHGESLPYTPASWETMELSPLSSCPMRAHIPKPCPVISHQ